MVKLWTVLVWCWQHLETLWRSRPRALPRFIILTKNENSLSRILSLEIQLMRKPLPDEKTLKVLAWYLYKQHRGRVFNRVFVLYYLPGQLVNHGAWATTNFYEDGLQVKINGVLKTNPASPLFME